MKKHIFAVGLLLLLIAVPVQAQTTPPASGAAQLTPAQRAEIEKTLTDATMAYTAEVNKMNLAGIEKYHSTEFNERVASGNITATGKDAALKQSETNISQRASLKVEIDSIKVHVLSPELAYVVQAGGVYVTLKSGRHGGYGSAVTRIWRKEPGGWKFIHTHESTW